MKSTKLLFLFISSLFGNCSIPEKENSYKETISVIDEYSNLIKKEKKIHPSMYGLEYLGEDKIYDGKIRVIALGYCVEKNFKYDEAREYFYSIVDGLIEHINKNTQLKKYFHHYPIDYSDLSLDFSFWVHDERHLKVNDVYSIHIGQNKIYYEIVNEDGSNEIKQNQITPDVFTITSMLERNRSIIRTIPEDLAMHSKEQ